MVSRALFLSCARAYTFLLLHQLLLEREEEPIQSGKILLFLSLSFQGLLSLSLLFRDRAEPSSTRRSFILYLHRVFCLHRVQYDRSV